MTLDDRVLDLLAKWEDTVHGGDQIDLTMLAGGDTLLAADLQRHVVALQKLVWLDQAEPESEELHLPSSTALRIALLLPDDLPLETLQANLTKAEILTPDQLAQLPRVKNAYQLSEFLLESELLTRFQLRSVANGRTRGLKLGRYVILDKIGSGGMGQVYKARHNKMDRNVALKVLPPEMLGRTNGIERFNQEVQLAAQLRHVNIVEAFDADEAEGLHFFVMEFVDGHDLSSVVRRQGPLPVAQAVDYMMQAARGLAYAHRMGLIHRDIKPANLLLNPVGVVKILDMGIARMQTDANQSGLTQNGAIMGTIDFMAPEQAIDAKTVTPQADLYSLGCSLCYLLTGRPPFGGESLMVKLLGHREQAPLSLIAARSDVPPELEAIYQKCLAKLPADRYPSAGDLLADLEKVPLSQNASPGPIALGEPQQEIDTSPTTHFATQAQLINRQLPAVVVEAGSSRGKRTRPKRGVPFFGGAIGVGLLLCGLLYYGAGLLFKISTPDGALVVEVDGDDFVAHLRDHDLQLVNQKTQETTTIQLRRTEQTKPLPPGQYMFALETSSGLKTNVRELTISSGIESKVHVYWEKSAEAVTVSSTPTDAVAAAPVVAKAAAASMSAGPVASDKPTSSPPHDYDAFATGKWVSLLTNQAEFDRWVAARDKPPSAGELVAFDNGVVTLRNATDLLFPPVRAKNFLFRARLKYESGLNICLKVRQSNPTYSAWWNFGGRHFGIGYSPVGARWKDLLTAHTRDNPRPFSEIAIAGIGRKFILYVDGKELFEVDREDDPTDQLSVGLGTARNSAGQYKDIQLMVLDDDVVKPASPYLQDPDYLAAKYALSVGGTVQANSGPYVSNLQQLQSPPFALTSVSFINNKQVTDDGLAIFENCTAVERLTMHGIANLTGRGLAYFRNCRSLRYINCNESPRAGSGLAQFADCKQLSGLQLWHVTLTLPDLLPLADRKLKDINLGGTAVTDDWLLRFTNVADLDFFNVRYTNVSDKGLAHFQDCKKIKYLSIGRTRVTDAGLAYFRECREMNHVIIAETVISDASIDVLKNFKNLKGIELEKTKITAAGVNQLHQALPQCKIVWDGGTMEPVKP
ncbi:serine/threonine protein kinase [Blastopirellula marina]|uniref:non-specific serine/threonine protein kinase n=1 Tax=Blastopirellula marina DSM 3645 TaxID=314230 RepID=A3ZRN9_9BACT|nr:serine/threonine-protein kinase [Blastopirellula marina]EAQ80808.1 serine/threonine protein kinase [Blastopirellula marina DSM 3645]